MTMLLDKFLDNESVLKLNIFLCFAGCTAFFMHLGASLEIAIIITFITMPWILLPLSYAGLFIIMCALLICDMLLLLKKMIKKHTSIHLHFSKFAAKWQDFCKEEVNKRSKQKK